jgi:hypothetical protein
MEINQAEVIRFINKKIPFNLSRQNGIKPKTKSVSFDKNVTTCVLLK